MEDSKIPIENIFYILLYSWEKIEEKELVNISTLEKKDLPNLLAKVLIAAVKRLLKSGLAREYLALEENLSTLRGKINFQSSIKTLSFIKAQMNCNFDELSTNHLLNQIIKRTLYCLTINKLLVEEVKFEVVKLYRMFNNIEEIELNLKCFKSVNIHRNNSHYGIIINICELLFLSTLIDEKSGFHSFKDFYLDEKQMPLIFERFIRNFYKHEQSEYIIKREDIHWDFEICEGSKAWVPKMQTDVSLISTSQKIIIETKYYKDALVKNFDSFKFRTSHLNQLNSYLDNIENLGKKEITGILLYPLAADNEEINFVAKYSKGTIKVKTVNLNANWKDIHQRLIELI